MQANPRISRPVRYAVIILLIILAASCSLVMFNSQGGVTTALEIFVISAVGFSLIAMFSYRIVIMWRAVDFPWILTSFAAIIVSLVNISAGEERQYKSTAQNEILNAFSSLIYVTRSIVTNDCETQRSAGDTRPSSPEPYSGACDRMKHDLPQMIYGSDQLSETINADYIKSFGRNVMKRPDTKLVGSWKDQDEAARNLIKTVDRYAPGLQKIEGSRGDAIEKFILSTRLRLWYFVMAFFVGMRLSKTTAEVLQARFKTPVSSSRT